MRGGRKGEARRSTRQRIYTLVAGALLLALGLGSLRGMLLLGRRKLDEKLYPYPWKVLVALAQVQERYRLHDLDGDGAKAYAPSLEALERAGAISHALAFEAVGGYRYGVVAADAQTWAIRAAPAAEDPAALHYWVDQTHVVRAARGRAADRGADVFLDPRRADVIVFPGWEGK